MARRLTPQAAFGFLMVLTGLSWAIVVAELMLTGSVSVFGIANAAVFTLTLSLWPLVTGARVTAHGVRVPEACRECGTLALPVPGISFCLRCGAYPRQATRAPARAPVAARQDRAV